MTLGRRRRGLLAVAAILWWTLAATPAQAQTTLQSFDATIQVNPDGTLVVTEDLVADFGSAAQRGIFRVIPIFYDLSTEAQVEIPAGRLPRDFVRKLEIDDIRVSSPSGAPTNLKIERPPPLRPGLFMTDDVTDDHIRIRIGEENTFIRGVHRYVISYRVTGALNRFADHDELYWNVTGTGWPFRIDRASAIVTGPGITEVTCFAGSFGAASPCSASGIFEQSGRFRADNLAAEQGLTIVVAFEPGSIDVAPPLLVERWSLSTAFAGSPVAVPLSVATSILGFGLVALLAFREGRDRVFVGGVSASGTMDSTAALERRRGLFEPRVVPVEFRPPDDLRPAELGLIIDERVDPVDISATVVDLAVRGYLKIEEVKAGALFWSRTDWRLHKLRDSEGLKNYERRVLDGIFSTGDTTRVSDLKGTFHLDYAAAERMLYGDAANRRWFRKPPHKVRSLWLGIGIGSIVVSVAAFVAMLVFTRMAVAALPLILASIALTVAHRWMPHRTPKGSRLLVRTLGFKEFIDRAEAERMAFAERENIFVEYLPYAVVFGATERWAKAFEDLGVGVQEAVGRFYVGPGPFTIAHFSAGMSDFGTGVGTALATTPTPSGSGSGWSGGGSGFGGGGFSGGGGGGGGGGSW